MTFDEAMTVYFENVDTPHGSAFMSVVGRFQEGFLSDGVTDDCDEAFVRAIDVASRLLPAIKAKAAA